MKGGDIMSKKPLLIACLSVLIVVIIVLGIIFGVKLFADPSYDAPQSTPNTFAKDVSMIQLIATPEKYDGEFVRVIGVGNLELEGNYISLSQEDWKFSVGNQIWIELGNIGISYEEATQYNGEYVILEGVFDKDDCGHFGMFHGSIKNISRYQLWNPGLTHNAMICEHEDKTYSYQITDYSGRVLGYEDNLTDSPERLHVSADVVGISVQTGTGLSTSYARFFDLENGKASETFHYVLAAKNSYVVYAEYRDGEHIIIVQDIFDKEQCYQEYKLENVSPVAADFAVGGYFGSNGSVNITYLAGEDFTETNYTILITPNKTAE